MITVDVIELWAGMGGLGSRTGTGSCSGACTKGAAVNAAWKGKSGSKLG